ncbi:transposable element Tcb2 transposase [Trichonephila clavipes]|nr:transposable element Tcb2 transposase [Trichonephila clavipes]
MYKNALKEDFIRVVEKLDAKVEDKQFKTLNKKTATHIGIREAEDWFRPIDLAKECDIYISSRSGSHKEIPITYGYTQDPFKNKSQNFKTKIKENYPQYHERENKNCYICGDSSHCARDCEKRFKPKESNDHIHNKINVNTLKIESEKQNSEECANLQYVNIFVENQPVTALIDSGCQIPVLNSSLIRVQTPSEEIITLSSCFGEQRMVEVKPINISLNQHSPSLSVGTAISPTLTEEFIIHPSVYSEIEKLGHAKSDVLLNESESSLGAHAYAYSSGVSFPNVSVSNVIENSSYDLPYVKNFNTRNDSSSLIKDYKCNKIKITKLKLSIVREKCSDIVLCKKANGAMKTSSVEFISRSPTPSPMNSKYRRFSSGLHGNTAADSVRSEWPLWHAAKSNAVFARMRIEMKLKLLDIRGEKKKRSSEGERERRRPGAGRPRTTTSTDDRYIQLTARRNRTENATQLQRQLLLATGRRVSSQTVRNRVHEGGLYARRPMVCIPLTPRHRGARRRWAAEHRDWEQHDWSQVLFTDESQFSLECDTRRVLLWRDRGTRNNPAFVR